MKSNKIRRLIVRMMATATVLCGMAFMPVYAVSDNTIGDNITENSGVGFVLMVSIQRNR